MIEADSAVFINSDEFAEAATFTPANGGPEEACNVIVEYGSEYGFSEVGTAKTALLHGRFSQVPVVSIDDKFTVGDVEWLVENAPFNDGIVWRAACTNSRRSR
jgi:hypothetical protein